MPTSTFHRSARPATYTVGEPEAALGFAGPLAVDIETVGLGVARWAVKAVSLGTADEVAVLDPADVRHQRAMAMAIDHAPELILHNSTFDVPALVQLGVMNLEHCSKVTDTLVYARLAQPDERYRKAQLGEACAHYLHEPSWAVDKRMLEEAFRTARMSRADGFRAFDLRSPAYAAYAAWDVVATAALAPAVKAGARRALEHEHALNVEELLEREQVVNRMMLRLSCRGLGLDHEALEELAAEMRATIGAGALELEEAGIDSSLDATKAKRAVLERLEELGQLPPSWERTPATGQLSTRRELMAELTHPLAQAITTMARARRFLEVYADKARALELDDVVHPQVNVLAAVTGRMSISDPPLQQLPESVRRMFRAPWPISSLDWSQVEPALAANLAGADMAPYEEGADLYALVAREAQVPRPVAKVVLLAQLYGQGLRSLGLRIGADTEQARRVRDAVLAAMPEVAELIAKVKSYADARGRIFTLSGRALPIPRDPSSGNRRFRGYLGVNYVTQGGAYDLLAEALVAVHRAGLDDAIFMVVHDELVVATEAAPDIERIMQRGPAALCHRTGRVPLLRTGRVDLGHSWAAKKEPA